MHEPLENAGAHESRVSVIRDRVVGMYSKHPWPGTRRTDEEMGWRLKVMGISSEDYRDKSVLDLGCGTGEYALWYATHGARHVTGVDLSDGSLARAQVQARQHHVDNVNFVKQDALALEFSDEQFDYSYSVGALHHTGQPLRGFQKMVRVTKPGGIVIISVYNAFTRGLLRPKQAVCRWLGGADIDARARWGRRLFPLTLRKLNKRYHGLNSEALSYDTFGFPHESLHTANEVLNWFKQTGVEYVGSFAPLRFRDYLFAFSLPDYWQFRQTFDGFPLLRLTSGALAKLAAGLHVQWRPQLRGPGRIETIFCQLAWVPFSLRFYCFTIAGRKR